MTRSTWNESPACFETDILWASLPVAPVHVERVAGAGYWLGTFASFARIHVVVCPPASPRQSGPVNELVSGTGRGE